MYVRIILFGSIYGVADTYMFAETCLECVSLSLGGHLDTFQTPVKSEQIIGSATNANVGIQTNIRTSSNDWSTKKEWAIPWRNSNKNIGIGKIRTHAFRRDCCL